jgi:hypothetical protein
MVSNGGGGGRVGKIGMDSETGFWNLSIYVCIYINGQAMELQGYGTRNTLHQTGYIQVEFWEEMGIYMIVSA